MEAPLEDRSQKLGAIREFCQSHPQAVLFDEPAESLFDVFGIKTFALSAKELRIVERRTNLQTKEPYVLLVYEDERQVALTSSGIGFAPIFDNSGPQELPEVVCFRDYRGLLDCFKHDLYGHPDTPPTRSTVQLLMMCIAVLDGARSVGFEIGKEERELETQINELEKRAPQAP